MISLLRKETMTFRNKESGSAETPSVRDAAYKTGILEKYEKFLMFALGLAVFLIHLPLVKAEAISPDACGYLDMGLNLLRGHAGYVSYNLYQYWTGPYYPVWPYMYWMYGMVAGCLYGLGGLKTAIGFNILLLGVNAVLLYRFARYHLSVISSLMITVFLVFSASNIFVAVYPWTEQFHLTALLIVVTLFVRDKVRPWVAGACAALLFFIRGASLYNLAGIFLSLFLISGFNKNALRKNLSVAAGMGAVILIYEMFCFGVWGELYPSHLKVSKPYLLTSTCEGASYSPQAPALRMPPQIFSNAVRWQNTKTHLKGFYRSLGILRFLLIPLSGYVIFELYKRKLSPIIAFCIGQGIGVVLGYATALSWQAEIEYDRYGLIPYLLLGLASLIVLRDFVRFILKFLSVDEQEWIFWACVIIFYCSVFPGYKGQYVYYHETHKKVFAGLRAQQTQIYDWIKENTKEDVLIASEEIVSIIRAERPIVSFPAGKALTPENVIDFLNVYKPEYLIIFNKSVIDHLKGLGWSVVIAEADITLLAAKEKI